MSSVNRAPFIVFEGIDGCGKTSACNAVAKNYPTIHLTREPGGAYLSEKIRNILLSDKGANLSPEEQMDLFFAARQIHLFEVINTKRNVGIPVFSDRFDASTFAFQKCVDVVGGLPLLNLPLYEEFFKRREHVVKGQEPSLYVYLNVDPVEGMRRRALARNQKVNHFDLAGLEEQKRRAASYEIFFDWVKQVRTSRVVVIDANQNQGKTIHDVMQVIAEELGQPVSN